VSQQYKPRVLVSVNPSKIVEGQMINVQAVIVDAYTSKPMQFDKMYMQIIDSTGLEVWPLSTIQKDSARFDKLISTSELKAGKYLIRVSPGKNLRPMGAVPFEVEKSDNPLIPLIPLVLLAIPASTLIKKVETDMIQPRSPELARRDNYKEFEKFLNDTTITAINPEKNPLLKPPKIALLLYRTEMDSRVCKICRGHRAAHSPGFQEGEYIPFAPEQPVIGPEQLGGDTHYNCRCHFDYLTELQLMAKNYREWEEVYQAKIIKAAQIANVYWTAQKRLKALEA